MLFLGDQDGLGFLAELFVKHFKGLRVIGFGLFGQHEAGFEVLIRLV